MHFSLQVPANRSQEMEVNIKILSVPVLSCRSVQ